MKNIPIPSSQNPLETLKINVQKSNQVCNRYLNWGLPKACMKMCAYVCIRQLISVYKVRT